MGGEIKTITIRVTAEEHREVKVIAAKAGKTLKQIFLEAIAKIRQQQEK